ncbi:outer membrane protein [Paracoccus sp. AK26]|uniref:outer membrane protein n=1 Tax=Paracoccus sp. AK26 TaxID=2589076 RepID=UPI0014283AE0|nr:outer membrane beta-barrel protein [Paracoccus sp. AK26]QIR86155.1 porin family protein [Paracoccus sp. AK26]
MRHSSFLAISALGLMSGTSGALAGGYIAPVADPVVAAPVRESASASDWAGGYVGGHIGYAFGGDDEVGADIYEDDAFLGSLSDLTTLKVKGLGAGVHLGYRWQRGNWVFGPELTLEGGDISDDKSGSDSVDGDDYTVGIESKVNHIVGLQFKTGYAVNPQTLVYGTAGYVRGDFDYILSASVNGDGGSITEGYTADGYSLGLGVERKIRDNLSVFAEWQYRNFGKTEITFTEGSDAIATNATPEHHNVKVGVNFSF